MSCADAMATPASNAAVLSNSCFLMEWFLLFTVPVLDPMLLRFMGKRISLARSSDRTEDFLRRVAARSRRFRWNQIRGGSLKITLFGSAKSVPPSQPTSGKRITSSMARGCDTRVRRKLASVNHDQVRCEVKRACLFG
jgi:hypothetical protein